MLIDAQHLRLTVDGTGILYDVSLHLEAGQIYGLLGPNGAGKSTSIALILGLYTADAGQLALFGEASPTALRRARARIGVMPEQAGFYDWMRAGDYLAWYARFYGGLQQPIPTLLTEVGLGSEQYRLIGQFSRGMRQRLALARALVHSPSLLILDEPTNGLDPRGRREIHDLLLKLAREKEVGVLLCTHLLDDVDRLCDRIGIIHRGRTVLEGPLIEQLLQQNVGRRFRLRMESFPEHEELPDGVVLLGHNGGWWHLRVEGDVRTPLPNLWGALLAGGWRFSEIRSEGGGLEELYLRSTQGSGLARSEAA